MGAGAAIRDAAQLTDELSAAERGDKPLLIAIRDYQEGARRRGADVIAASLPTIRQILATGTPTGSTLTKLALPLMATIRKLRAR